jgi:hypothetical protein
MSIPLPQLLLGRTSKFLPLVIGFSLFSAAFAEGAGHPLSDVNASEATDKAHEPSNRGSAMPDEFLGIWGSSFETCDDENIGLRLLVRADFLALTDWSKPDWVLLVRSVSVDANDSRSIIIYLDPPKPLSKSPDYQPVVRFDKFGKMTLSEDGQTLTISDPANATSSAFVFCSALPDHDKKAG